MKDPEAGEKTGLLSAVQYHTGISRDTMKKSSFNICSIVCWLIMVLLLVFLVIMTAVFTGTKMTANTEVPDDGFDNILTKGLGTINFNGLSTADASARGHFLLGLKLMSVFWYDLARTEFQRARSIDPKMAMAYWGEAMTYKHALGEYEDLPSAQAILTNITDEVYANTIDRERNYIDAARVLFAPGGSRADRERAYTDKMREMYDVYPEYANVCAFYGLAVLSGAKSPMHYMNVSESEVAVQQARVLLEGCISRAGDRSVHPGLLNYLVHAYDAPDIVEDPALGAKARMYADKLAAVAYLAPTAINFRTRVYFRFGMWDQVVAGNLNALDPLDYYCQNHGIPGDVSCMLNIRSTILDWRHYGLVQQAKFGEAGILLDNARSTAIIMGVDREMYKVWMYRMYAVQQIQSQLFPQVIGLVNDNANELTDPIEPLTFDLFWAPHAESHALLAKAYGIVFSKATLNQAAITNMTLVAIVDRLTAIQSNITSSPDGTAEMASMVNVVKMQVQAIQMIFNCWTTGVPAASAECAEGENGWVDLMSEAFEAYENLEDTPSFPSLVISPVAQMYGDMLYLSESNNTVLMTSLYDDCLEDIPNKLGCVVGMARAHKRAYDVTRDPESLQQAKEWYAKVTEQVKPAAVDRNFPPLLEAAAVARM